MASSLPRRIAVSAVGIPTALGIVFVGGWLLVIALAVLGLLGVRELFLLAAARGARPLALPGYLAAVAAPVAVYALTGMDKVPPLWIAYGAVLWVILTVATALARRSPSQGPLAAVAITLFGAIYAGLLPAFAIVIRHGNVYAAPWAATALVFAPLVITLVCDTMAMAGGALFGGPKFAPVVSPNKTWAGTIAGTASAAVVAPLYGWLVLQHHGISLGVGRLILFGIVLSILGQFGDLAESLFKREAGVKDSGSVFPGHGGVLDRLDSLYWVLPAAAAMLTLYGAL
jgi:phosphatidate cytidylyltransferase